MIQRAGGSFFIYETVMPELPDLWTEVFRCNHTFVGGILNKVQFQQNKELCPSCLLAVPLPKYEGPICHLYWTQGILEVGRDLWRLSMEFNTSAEAASTTASCSGLGPIRFCVPLKTGTPQWPRAACSRLSPLHSEKVLYLNGISWFAVCALYFSCLLSFHCIPARKKPNTILTPDRHLYKLLKSPPAFPSQR